jgi:hypothetical protein
MSARNPTPKHPDTREQLERAWKIYLLNHEILRVADRKLQFLIVIALVVAFGVAWIMIAGDGSGADPHKGHSWWLIVFLLTYFVSLLKFFFNALYRGLYAATDTVTRDRGVERLIFFKHINEQETHEHYFEAFGKSNPEDALKDVVFQIREIAYIVDQKYIHYKKAWSSIGVQLVLALAILLAKTHGY